MPWYEQAKLDIMAAEDAVCLAILDSIRCRSRAMTTLSETEKSILTQAAGAASLRADARLDLFNKIREAIRFYLELRSDHNQLSLVESSSSFTVYGYGASLEFILAGDPNVITLKVDKPTPGSTYKKSLHYTQFPVSTTTIPEVITVLETSLEASS